MKHPIPKPRSTQPPARAPRPRNRTSSAPGQNRPRTILAKAIANDSVTELVVVLDRFQRISPHSVSKNVKRMIEDHIDTLGLRRVCNALSEAAATHEKLGVGLIKRFLTICEEMPDKLMAQEDRRREAWEAAQQKRLEQWEADAHNREAANEGPTNPAFISFLARFE